MLHVGYSLASLPACSLQHSAFSHCCWLASSGVKTRAELVSFLCQYVASPPPRLLHCLLLATRGNWAPCGPRLNCRGSRSSSGPQSRGARAHRCMEPCWRASTTVPERGKQLPCLLDALGTAKPPLLISRVSHLHTVLAPHPKSLKLFL